MRIERIELHHIKLELVRPFETSVVRELERPLILVAVHSGGLVGWGECSAEAGPWHTSETIETAWHVLRVFLIPSLLGQEIESPEDVVACFPAVRGHNLARAGLENAVWDLLAKARGVSLAQIIGGTRDRVPVGVSVGMEATLDLLLQKVTQYVADGYRRVKLKIKPGWDVAVVRAVRERWPELLLQVDALVAGLRQAVDGVHHEVEAVQIVQHRHVECRRDGALFLIAPNMHVVMISTAVGQLVNQRGVSVKREDDRLVFSE